MPLYDYKCECGMTVEKQHGITVRPVVQCICGKFMEKQISSGISVRWGSPPDTASKGKETQ